MIRISAYPLLILLFGGILVSILLSSCQLQDKSRLFRTPESEAVYRKGRKQDLPIIRLKPKPNDTTEYRYAIQPGDEIRVRFLNLPPELAEGNFGVEADEKYIVNTNGYLATPLIGPITAMGLSIADLQAELIKAYSVYYHQPSIDVSVSNLRVYIYGEARTQGVVVLPNEKTHLIEALALSGGILNSAKTQKIKIIRGNLNDPQIIWVDLRKAYGLRDKDLYMRSGDIVYIETRNLTLFVREAQPYTTLINVLTLLPTFYILFVSFR
jgi:polysaccharide biosynthesis/export protein